MSNLHDIHAHHFACINEDINNPLINVIGGMICQHRLSQAGIQGRHKLKGGSNKMDTSKLVCCSQTSEVSLSLSYCILMSKLSLYHVVLRMTSLGLPKAKSHYLASGAELMSTANERRTLMGLKVTKSGLLALHVACGIVSHSLLHLAWTAFECCCLSQSDTSQYSSSGC